MADGNMKLRLILLLPVLLFGEYYYSYGLQQHIVGDSIWSIPPTNDFYANWSSSYSFHIGDSLYFDFDSGHYNVIQVSRGAFDSCSGDQPYNALMEGPLIFPLSRKGLFYFICNVSNYCQLGLKVSVIVDEKSSVDISTTPPPSPSLSGGGNPPQTSPAGSL